MDSATLKSFPVQVEYQDGPIFRNLGRGVWVYDAASGDLILQCSSKGAFKRITKRHRPTGTGAFRLQTGCDAMFDSIQLPGYIHGDNFCTTFQLYQ